MVIAKTRYSGFQGPTLDFQLRMRGIQNLFMTVIAPNVCVESTLRHGYFLDYWPLLIAEAPMQAGPSALQEATLSTSRASSVFGPCRRLGS